MARKSSSSAVQEELYPLSHGAPGHDGSDREAREREAFDDARLVDLEAEQESPFLRGQKRVSVRRGSLPKKTANQLKWVALALVAVALAAAFGAVLYGYGKHSWRFRIDSSDQIEVVGTQHVTHPQIMEVMGGDIGRNIFFVPLAQRKQQLEQIPWVESASVMRFVPNRLRVEIHERTPVAFARIGSHISLIDAGGNLMDLAPGGKHRYSFPVIAGMNAGEPLSTRAVRMKNYNDLMRQLDSSGAQYSQEISEVDLSDTEDAKVMASDSSGEVLVHLGNGNYLQRYKVYVTHVQAWRQQFDKLDSVDLRYDGQIIVNPDLQGIARQPTLTPAAARAAVAAGVKNAAIVNYEKFVTPPAPATLTAKKAQLKPKAALKPAKTTGHPAAAKPQAKAVVAKNSALAPPGVAAAAASKKTPDTTNARTPPSGPFVAKSTTSTAPRTIAKQTAAAKPATAAPKNSSPPIATAAGQKKPSAAIPRETPQN